MQATPKLQELILVLSEMALVNNNVFTENAHVILWESLFGCHRGTWEKYSVAFPASEVIIGRN